MNPIYADLIRWACYVAVAVCAAGCIFVIALIPLVMVSAIGGACAGEKGRSDP